MPSLRKSVFPLVASILVVGTGAYAQDGKLRLFATRPQSALTAQIRSVGESAAESFRMNAAENADSRREVSRGGAMLRSLLIPGWGEAYLGYHGTANAFFWSDVAIWATVIGLETYSRWREDQFIAFATQHSGAQMSGKSDSFYAVISNYRDTEAYNEAKLRNRDFDALYTDPSYYWSWDSDQSRLDYDHIRLSSRAAHNKIYFFIGAAALNRIISVIDAGKKAGDLHKNNRIGLHAEPEWKDHAATLRLVLTADLSP
jgi:hypothetical protein